MCDKDVTETGLMSHLKTSHDHENQTPKRLYLADIIDANIDLSVVVAGLITILQCKSCFLMLAKESWTNEPWFRP